MQRYARSINLLPSLYLVRTHHFVLRQAQRGIRNDAVLLTLRFGLRYHEHGDTVFFLGRRQLPGYLPESVASRAEGTVVIVNGNGSLKTTFRNPVFCRTARKQSHTGASGGRRAMAKSAFPGPCPKIPF